MNNNCTCTDSCYLNSLCIAQCDYPLNNNQEYSLHDHDTLVLGYNVPSLEGSNITFACFPGMVLTGPTASTCMSSGLWIPNPKEVICLGKFIVTNQN